jgi:purine-cytosine permease-like protein
MLADLVAIALLLVTVAFLGLGVALAFVGAVGAALAIAAERPATIDLPARLGFATIALLGLLIFVLATIAFIPQLP